MLSLRFASLKHVKKTITTRLFSLRKIRKYITEKTAVIIYKQTILPIIDHSGFLLLSCCVGDRYDLQKIQNDILRVCFRSVLIDRMKICDLHKKANLLSLEQRMRKQLLWLMFNMSLDPNNRKIGPRTLRSNNKYIFKTNTKSVLNINEVHSTKVQFSGMSYRKMYNLRIMCMNLKNW